MPSDEFKTAIRTVNTDGTDKLISYDGCGCAGGQVTTVKGENITETDWQGNATANLGRRTQKIYADILGRAYKTEVMNWDGATPYTTAVTQFNGRDQAVSTTRYKGAAGSADPEQTTFQYDGHGRLKQQHSPSQDAAANVSYAYFNDDSVHTATDGRGASVDYTYGDARGLLTRAAYSAPVNSGIQVPDATEFGYDALGNRTWMTDSLGRADYAYDSLSHLTQETRTITNVGAWTLSYQYGLSGQLKAVNQPDDMTRNVGYEYDRAGSLKKVSGGFANVPYYADGIDYRAFGAAKSLTYGSGKQLTQSYNNLMQLAEYKVADALGEETRTQFDYFADGRVKFVRDKTNNQTTSDFDRAYSYDQTGRTVGISTGAWARGESAESGGVFYQNNSYDEFGNLTGRDGMNWAEYAAGFTATYQHYRRTDANYEYDADGRNTRADTLYSKYDAAGRRYRSQSPLRFGSSGQLVIEQGFDGDGRRIKQSETKGTAAATVSYQLHSSVLGGAEIAEIKLTNGTWQKAESFVYAAGETIAQQTLFSDGSRQIV